jgi:hypothetical protein
MTFMFLVCVFFLLWLLVIVFRDLSTQLIFRVAQIMGDMQFFIFHYISVNRGNDHRSISMSLTNTSDCIFIHLPKEFVHKILETWGALISPFATKTRKFPKFPCRALRWWGQDLLHSMLKAMPLLQIVLHTWICVVAIHTIQSQKNHHKVINFLCILLDLHQQEGTTWCLLLKSAIVGGWVCGCLIPSSPCPGYDSVDTSLSISNS